VKAALDTDAIIDLCDNDTWVDRVARHFKTNQQDTLFLVAHAWGELDEKKRGEQERVNLRRLEAACVRDNQRYFILGTSDLGGPDVMLGDTTKHDGILRVVHDIQPAYDRYWRDQEARGLPVKRIEKWIRKNNNQTDALIYARAAELGCDFLVTKDTDIRVPATNRCQPITLASFLEKLEP